MRNRNTCDIQRGKNVDHNLAALLSLYINHIPSARFPRQNSHSLSLTKWSLPELFFFNTRPFLLLLSSSSSSAAVLLHFTYTLTLSRENLTNIHTDTLELCSREMERKKKKLLTQRQKIPIPICAEENLVTRRCEQYSFFTLSVVSGVGDSHKN